MNAVIVALGLAALAQVGAGEPMEDKGVGVAAASAETTGQQVAPSDIGAPDPVTAGATPATEQSPVFPGGDAPKVAAPPTGGPSSEVEPDAASGIAATPAEAAPSAAAPRAVPKTSDLIREWSKSPVSGQLSGIPITLAQTLRGATTRQQQTDRTMAYWDLAAKVTQYYLVLRDSTELALLEQGVTTPGPAWRQKQLALKAELDLARQSAEAAQVRFQHLIGRSNAMPLPLPADLPHCGQYETQYSRIFANREDAAARQLNDLLPLKYAELRNQAQLVSQAYDWLQQVSEVRDPSTDGTGLLRAHELVSLRRRTLVESVRDYNQDIVAYTELAAPSQVGTDRLVAMLIQVSNPTVAAGSGSGVQQASAIEDAPPAESSVLKRFGDSSQWRQVRRPAFWRLRNREHSILVPRQRLFRGN